MERITMQSTHRLGHLYPPFGVESFMNAIQDIINALGHTVTELDVNESFTFEVPGLEDLTIEKISQEPTKLSVSQTYTQRGDLMRDPEVVFRIEDETWVPIEFRQDPQFYEYDENGLNIEGFLEQWGSNLRKQGFPQKAADRGLSGESDSHEQ
jgi:hypothetical protein